MSVGIHTFVQDTYNFDAVAIGISKEDHVTALREFSRAFSNIVSGCREPGSFGESAEGVKQLTDSGVTLWLSPV